MIRLAILYFFINKTKVRDWVYCDNWRWQNQCSNWIWSVSRVSLRHISIFVVYKRHSSRSKLHHAIICRQHYSTLLDYKFHNRCITFATRSRNVGRKSGKWLIIRTNVTSIEIEIRSNLTTLFMAIHSIHKKKSNILVLQSDKI